MPPTYEQLYDATERAARVWAWRFGASTADEIDEAVNAAWLRLLEAAPVFVSLTHGAVYLRRCVLTATRLLLRPTCERSLGAASRKAVQQSEDVEQAVWALAEQLPGWYDCSQRERFALVLTAAGWTNKEIAATAPQLYPRATSAADAAWRARLRIRHYLDLTKESNNGQDVPHLP